MSLRTPQGEAISPLLGDCFAEFILSKAEGLAVTNSYGTFRKPLIILVAVSNFI